MTPDPALLSVDQVARQLGVHVRTVRRYLREGRLKGRRIGKQYRITPADLADLTGQVPPKPVPAVRVARHVEASAVVQFDALAPAEAMRIANGVTAAIHGHRSSSSTPVRLEAVYDEQRARLKIILTGDLFVATGVMQLLESYTQDEAGGGDGAPA